MLKSAVSTSLRLALSADTKNLILLDAFRNPAFPAPYPVMREVNDELARASGVALVRMLTVWCHGTVPKVQPTLVKVSREPKYRSVIQETNVSWMMAQTANALSRLGESSWAT